MLGAQPTNLSLAGDCRFVSATFRLFKVPGSSRAGPGQVVYNGGIVGHERELVFDANFTFKVRRGAPLDAEQSWSVGLGMGQS